VTRADPHAGVHAGQLAMTLMWGGSWPAGRVLALAMPPLSSSAWRFSFAAVVLLAWMAWRQRTWPRLTHRQWIGLAAGGAIGVAGYAVFFMMALHRVEASRAAVVVTTNPVFTTLLAAWLFKEALNARIVLGLACAVIGAATVLTHGAPWKLFTGEVGLGEWLLLGCIATWVAYTLINRRLLAGIDALTATAVSAAIGSVLLWVVTIAIEGGPSAAHSLAALDAAGWAALVFMALGSTVLAYAWYFRGVAALGAGTAASYISLVPIIGVASSALVLGERIDTSLAIGGALAILGVVINNRSR
jgi:drug/metabolite transporter (DMT)-like permease